MSLATSGDLNPFNLVGMAFLGVLIPLIVAATVAGRMIYRLLRAAEALPGDDKIDLDWQEAAYLAGGPSRLSAAVIARLVESGAAVVTSDKSLHPTGTTPSDMSPLETAVLALLPVNAKKSSAQSSFALIDATVTNAFEPRMASLTSRGLICQPQVGI